MIFFFSIRETMWLPYLPVLAVSPPTLRKGDSDLLTGKAGFRKGQKKEAESPNPGVQYYILLWVPLIHSRKKCSTSNFNGRPLFLPLVPSPEPGSQAGASPSVALYPPLPQRDC